MEHFNETLEEIRSNQAWTDRYLLALCLKFISESNDEENFIEFLLAEQLDEKELDDTLMNMQREDDEYDAEDHMEER